MWSLGSRVLSAGVVVALAVFGGGVLAAEREADDLQAMIDRAKDGLGDLERLDERGAAKDEVGTLRLWLEESWKLWGEKKYDDVRIVLDRCDAQTEMIRQKIQASKLAGQAREKEEKLARLKEDVDRTRQAIEQAKAQKAALEPKAK